MQWIKQRLSPLIGQRAEKKARDYLTQQGLNFLYANYRCRQGEVDLIMEDAGVLVFVEVKFRQKQLHGRAEEFFHLGKRAKFEKAVQQYLYENKLNPASVDHRLDVVAINGSEIDWYKQV